MLEGWMSDLLFTKRVLSFSTQSLDGPENELRQALADQADTHIWGIWHGLFGLAANQLILMTAHSKQLDEWQDLADCEVLSRTVLRPTVRPLSAEPLDDPGIYVFRDFWLPGAAIEEAVSLSSAAWQTFEDVESYGAKPIGLFEPANVIRTGQETILSLLTWYPDFASWETSREPDPQARQRFSTRRNLTRTTSAIATRLRLP
jgi:hypothetical protein